MLCNPRKRTPCYSACMCTAVFPLLNNVLSNCAFYLDDIYSPKRIPDIQNISFPRGCSVISSSDIIVLYTLSGFRNMTFSQWYKTIFKEWRRTTMITLCLDTLCYSSNINAIPYLALGIHTPLELCIYFIYIYINLHLCSFKVSTAHVISWTPLFFFLLRPGAD